MADFLRKLLSSFLGNPAAGELAERMSDARAPAAGKAPPDRTDRLTVDELARRLGTSAAALQSFPIAYHTFTLPKKSGGTRTITAPSPELKKLQRTILRKLLGKLKAHPCATGFEKGHSILTNAQPHAKKEVVFKLDLEGFFPATSAARVRDYFAAIGWDKAAAETLTKLCTYNGALPQGAPTSPRLSNLLNVRFDARLAALAAGYGMSYSRYADDITLSGNATRPDSDEHITSIIHAVKRIAASEGYRLHTRKKLRIARRHDRQIVTGLVVNEQVNLPRKRRRWLRAVEHHLSTGRAASITREQLAGWKALAAMVNSSRS